MNGLEKKLKDKVIFRREVEIDKKFTSHGIGYKKVFLTNNECNSQLMQAAIGEMQAGEIVEQHIHPTMEEYYFVLAGKILFHVDKEMIECTENCFIKIPSNTIHFIEVLENCKFLYWGIAI